MTDNYQPWFDHDQFPKLTPGKTVVYGKLLSGQLARYDVETGDHAHAIWAVSKEIDARPVLAVIDGGRA